MKPNTIASHVISLLRAYGQVLRIHQWVKNTLIFVPLVLAGRIETFPDTLDALLGFVILSLTASATYIINDLLDIESDRNHAIKKHRPFASRRFSRRWGIGVSVVLAAAAISLSWHMPNKFIETLLAYTTLTLLYSFVLKKRAIIDVLTLAILFTLRIAAGMVLIPSPISYWLLLFSLFFFLSLALVKRYAELNDLAKSNGYKISGRVYVVTDCPFIMSTGLASAFAGCLVFVIYIANEHFPRDIYSHPEWLWAICAVLVYWLVRIWFLASRGAMNQDPILFALTDRASLAMGVLTVGFVALAW